MSMQLVAIYRSATYSPGRHRSNDAAIMDAVTAHLADAGWEVERLGEGDVEAGILPPADLYLNMCQGIEASERLRALESAGAWLINRASSVLRCHRHRLVRILGDSGLAFPATTIVSTHHTGDGFDRLATDTLWVKRGDVHAQQAADVVRTDRHHLAAALRDFADRGIERVAIQEHVPGEVVKFYGVAGGSFFRAFREDGSALTTADRDHAALRDLALRAARAVGLSVFGGDAMLAPDTAPVLVDLNDWPSFAPIRDDAARAIATLVDTAAMQRSA